MKADDTNKHMERIYSSVPHEDIPWNRQEPPAVLVELIEQGMVKPCKAIDIGCGTGNYTFYLQANGFQVTGVDVSPTAIAAAKKKSQENGVKVDLVVADMTADISQIKGTFDFVHEWMVLHHILPPDRAAYLSNIMKLLNSGGSYLSVSFSEANEGFGEPPTGKWRKSPMGPTIYCGSLEETAAFFEPYCTILKQELIEIPGKKDPHKVNYLYMRKK